MISRKRIFETDPTDEFGSPCWVRETFGAGIEVHVVPPSWVRAMDRQEPEVHCAIPSTKPICEDTKEADSGSNPDGRAEATTVGDSEAGGMAIFVAVADFGLFVENPRLMAIGAATRITKPATTDQIIILLRFVMGSLPPRLKITAGQME